MSPHRIFSILVCGTGLAVVGGPAVAQQAPPWNEGPGDIIISRQVPHQNAVLAGEPGRPTLVNPRTLVTGTIASSLGAGLFARPLSDLEAEAVRATRTPESGARGDFEAMASDEVGGASFAGSQALGHERSGLVGGAVSGALGGATRQIQGVLAGAFGRGG